MTYFRRKLHDWLRNMNAKPKTLRASFVMALGITIGFLKILIATITIGLIYGLNIGYPLAISMACVSVVSIVTLTIHILRKTLFP